MKNNLGFWFDLNFEDATSFYKLWVGILYNRLDSFIFRESIPCFSITNSASILVFPTQWMHLDMAMQSTYQLQVHTPQSIQGLLFILSFHRIWLSKCFQERKSSHPTTNLKGVAFPMFMDATLVNFLSLSVVSKTWTSQGILFWFSNDVLFINFVNSYMCVELIL